MIPTKQNVQYAISCLGPYDYNKYGGIGVFTGLSDDFPCDGGLEKVFEFEIEDGSFCWFGEKDIIGEIK